MNRRQAKALALQPYKVGSIVVHSAGHGHDTFYQVVQRTDKMAIVRRLRVRSTHDKHSQTSLEAPIHGSFEKRFPETYRLRVAPNGRLGPLTRGMWWKAWDGKAKLQYST